MTFPINTAIQFATDLIERYIYNMEYSIGWAVNTSFSNKEPLFMQSELHFLKAGLFYNTPWMQIGFGLGWFSSFIYLIYYI